MSQECRKTILVCQEKVTHTMLWMDLFRKTVRKKKISVRTKIKTIVGINSWKLGSRIKHWRASSTESRKSLDDPEVSPCFKLRALKNAHQSPKLQQIVWQLKLKNVNFNGRKEAPAPGFYKSQRTRQQGVMGLSNQTYWLKMRISIIIKACYASSAWTSPFRRTSPFIRPP